jgi:predicted dehydrogenase
MSGAGLTRWAMVGTGFMLKLIAPDLARTENVRLQVIVSRTPERAALAAAEHGIPESSGDLDEVLARDDIDVVYVATPHTEHARIARAALAAGKHVLVEKPMTTTAEDTRDLCAFAAERRLFLMEAMWTAFAPAIIDLRRHLHAGDVGEIQHVTASFCIKFQADSFSRLWDPNLGGGTTLDQGVYPLSFAHMVLGPPKSVTATGTTWEGVDVEAVAILEYATGARVVCTSSMRAHGQTGALVAGTTGSIEVPGPFWGPDRLLMRRGPSIARLPVEQVIHEREGAGYVPMLRAVSDAVLSGKTEHDLRTHADSIAVAETMDAVLGQLHQR